MANISHYTKSDIKDLFKEHDRTAKYYKNSVDLSRSHLNFGYGILNAGEAELAHHARVADIMQGRKVQEQTTFASEWIITYPYTECHKQVIPTCEFYKYPVYDEAGNIIHNAGDEKTKEINVANDEAHLKKFFDICYKFACDRYGKENILSAWVHMDETTPHLHLCLVPEATSRKTGKRTVSSASIFNKKELSTFHKDLQDTMNAEFGPNDYILNGRTKGNYTPSELRQRDADKQELRDQMNTVSAINQQLTDERLLFDEEKAQLEADQEEVEELKEVYQDKIDNFAEDAQQWIDDKVDEEIHDMKVKYKKAIDETDRIRQELEEERKELKRLQIEAENKISELNAIYSWLSTLTLFTRKHVPAIDKNGKPCKKETYSPIGDALSLFFDSLSRARRGKDKQDVNNKTNQDTKQVKKTDEFEYN